MQNVALLRLQLNHHVTQARQDIYTLSMLQDNSMKQRVLQRLWDHISSIHFISELLANQAQHNYYVSPMQTQLPAQPYSADQSYMPPITPSPEPTVSLPASRTFTIEELARFDGKNGRAAYVAVDGVVYDVTNNRAWAAATHFALTAGKEHTEEFASCHAGQRYILESLPVVGRLI
ncbi:cytochrome b5 [Bacillus sp. HMF5848]|uniref:cytochrome b5 domain-containing protein n=1 Tax=Bacillus sp. HMF5848 TaxID=2495421 RepID=UPI000F7944B5|nr:cytochrome b5 domain-containing protein [Bacillus sp. HMF5848]RSK25906.1 cytochrome b5 [Bacillus sp. HMF5848]